MTVSADWARNLAETRVLVVGDVMLDRYWFGDVDRISPEAPVPVVHVRREEHRLGGAANVAANIRGLGAQASLLSVIGSDEAGDLIERQCAAHSIRAHLCRDLTMPTTVKLRISGRSQQLLRVDFETRPQDDVLAQLGTMLGDRLEEAAAVVFSDYGKGGLGHVARMIGAARSAGRPVFVDPKGRDFTPYRGATAITPNRAELAAVIGGWTSEAELTAKAQALRRDLDIDAMILTRSEEGMSLFDDEGRFDVPAEAREVFDVTGAGDTVIATFASLAATGMRLRAALPFANRAGGLVVGRFGTATVTAEELSG